jgi:hypothetical protein
MKKPCLVRQGFFIYRLFDYSINNISLHEQAAGELCNSYKNCGNYVSDLLKMSVFLPRFFIGYWILKRGRISIQPFFFFYSFCSFLYRSVNPVSI